MRFSFLLCFISALLFSCKKFEKPQLAVYDSVTGNKIINNNDSAVYSYANYVSDTTLYFNVLNFGEGELKINDILVEGQDASGFVLKMPDKKVISKGAGAILSLSYKMHDFKNRFFNLVIKSNDKKNPVFTIPVRLSFIPNVKYFEDTKNLLSSYPTLPLNVNPTPNSAYTFYSNKGSLRIDLANNASILKIKIINNLSFGQRLILISPSSICCGDYLILENRNYIINLTSPNNNRSYQMSVYSYYRQYSFDVAFTNNYDAYYDPTLSKKVDTDIEIYENNSLTPSKVVHLKQD